MEWMKFGKKKYKGLKSLLISDWSLILFMLYLNGIYYFICFFPCRHFSGYSHNYWFYHLATLYIHFISYIYSFLASNRRNNRDIIIMIWVYLSISFFLAGTRFLNNKRCCILLYLRVLIAGICWFWFLGSPILIAQFLPFVYCHLLWEMLFLLFFVLQMFYCWFT